LFLLVGPIGAAGAEDVLQLEAAIDGRDVAGAGNSDPVVIDPSGVQQIELVVSNPTDSPVTVSRVRLQGDVGGLTVVAYDVGTDLEVDSGATERLELPVEFIGIEEQADGLLPGGFVLYDDERNEVATEDFVIDVKGDATSVMSLFAIFVAVATGASLVMLSTRIARRTLIGNRFRRGLQSAAVGLGVGATLVLGLAVLRVVAPTASVWVPLLLIPAVDGGALGYLSPGPLDFEPDEIDRELGDTADDDLDRSPPLDGPHDPPTRVGPAGGHSARVGRRPRRSAGLRLL
jgi:hypothetical protein